MIQLQEPRLPSWQVHELGAHKPKPDQRPDGTRLFPKAQGIWWDADPLEDPLLQEPGR